MFACCRRRNRTSTEHKEGKAVDLDIPRGPTPLPVIGNLLDCTGLNPPTFLEQLPDGGLHAHLVRLAAQYGSFFTMKFPSGVVGQPLDKFGGPTAVLSDPELLEEMFSQPDVFMKRLFKHSSHRSFLEAGNGIFMLDDDEPLYDQVIRVVRPAFSVDSIKGYLPLILDTTEVLMQRLCELGERGAVEIRPVLGNYTFDIIGKITFGYDFDSLTRPCPFLDLFNQSSESLYSFNRGIAGFGSHFTLTKVMGGVVSGTAIRLLRDMLRMDEELKVLIATKKEALFGSGGFPFSDAAATDAMATDLETGLLFPDGHVHAQGFPSGNAIQRCMQRVKEKLKSLTATPKEASLVSGGCPVSGAAATAASGGCPFATVKAGGRDVQDLVTRMLTIPDPETGKKIPYNNLSAQCSTFLIAGHDSTAIATTMLLYHVASNPDVEEKVYNEVVSIVGDGPITMRALGGMKYCTQVIKENLRLFSPANTIIRTSPPDREVKLGPYRIPPGTSLIGSTWGVHRNPKDYPDPLKFDPSRWSDDNDAVRSPYAFTAFGHGKRTCIGQQLSLLEQKVCLASVCRRFHLRVDPATRIKVATKAFTDADGVFLKLFPRAARKPRQGADAVCTQLSQRRLATLSRSLAPAIYSESAHYPSMEEDGFLKGMRLVVLFGSNTGTCEDFADRVVASGEKLGMSAEKYPLDRLALGLQLPRADGGVVILVTSVYNGLPPDNARHFDKWLDTPAARACVEGACFGVFGCGNRQWAATYMKFPRKVQERFKSLGGALLLPMGEGDSDGGETEFRFARWLSSAWTALVQAHGTQVLRDIQESICMQQSMCLMPPSYEVTLQTEATATDLCVEAATASLLASGSAFLARVSCNRELVTSPGRSTRHIEIELPEGVTYAAGDHLGVFGANPDEVVIAYMERLELPHDSVVRFDLFEGRRKAAVPLGEPISAFIALAYYFELQQPATRAQLSALSGLAADPAEATRLRALAGCNDGSASEACPDEFELYMLKARRTLLEILQAFPSVDAPVGLVLGMLPPMKPRYYSISSSPKRSPRKVAISVSVVQGISPSGREHKGLCSTFLKEQATEKFFPPSVVSSRPQDIAGRGMPLVTFVRDTGSEFRLPNSNAPVIMVGPGTGVAPMRGFIQDRVAEGRNANVLFFGCRDETDYIYREELESWQGSGALQLFVAFSRKHGHPKAYVQDLLSQQAELLVEHVRNGAFLYICGDASKMAPDVKATIGRVLAAAGLGEDCVEKLAAEGRYCEDVWAAQSL